MKPLALPIPEFYAAIGCGRSTAYELIRRGEVTAVKLGRKTVVTVASIEAMLERNAVLKPATHGNVVSHDESTPAKRSEHSGAAMCRLACNGPARASSNPTRAI